MLKTMFHSLKIFLQSFPPHVIFWKLKSKLLGRKIPDLKHWQSPFENKSGIEIGGPSAIFLDSGFLPLYSIVQNLDGVNFSSLTEWEGEIKEGLHYQYGNRRGHQFILEGGALEVIQDETYDFLLSCNNLEHIANPIATIHTWKRVVKPGGHLLLILPNKKANFDHRRPDTTLAHLIDDFKNNVGENDMTHLQEILELHDLSRDPKARPYSKFEVRCKDNFNNRCLHHHVFSTQLLQQLAEHCQLKTVKIFSSPTDHFALLQKY